MAFADDLCLIFELHETEQLQQIMDQWCNEFNMRLSVKSKYFVINSNQFDDEFELRLDGIEIERVNGYKYLGFNM